uniref:Knottin scorpion toxin-like domain-containing protein n=1 Tax=Aegilops tauschii subsp. strangulata TaxID=200361 RepID=A0A452XBR4_AEGTS
KHKQEKEACIDLMEQKTILLCLFVLLLLGNSTHAEMHCELHVPFYGTTCIESACQNACRGSWGDHTKKAYCAPVHVSLWGCHCIVCDF